MSMWIKSKQAALRVVLNGKGCLVSLAKGQIEQELGIHDLLKKNGNNEDVLVEG
jgi:hypothetical protein